MKLKEMALANALAAAMAVSWVICTLFVVLFPGLSLSLTRDMIHGLNVEALGSWQITLGNFISGGVMLSVFAWIFGWVLAYTYNRLTR
jgi:hypothetical protein